MPFPSHLLTDTVIVSRYLGRGGDAFATAQYGPQEKVRCAFQEAMTMVRDTDGNERSSASNLVTRARIGLEDRCWIPTENGVVPDATDDNKAVVPIALRNDRSRRAGFRMFTSFF